MGSNASGLDTNGMLDQDGPVHDGLLARQAEAEEAQGRPSGTNYLLRPEREGDILASKVYGHGWQKGSDGRDIQFGRDEGGVYVF